MEADAMAVAERDLMMAHQIEGVEFLLRHRVGLLAFEQGLGKTFVAIEAFRRLQSRGAATTLVVICPNTLKRNWVSEVARFAPGLSTAIVEGPAARRREILGTVAADIVIIGYESARKDITGVRGLLARRRAVLVLDESHYIKNHQSLSNIASRQFAPLTAYRWLLTGTPVTNSALDLYGQLSLLGDGNPLGSFPSFASRYSGLLEPTDQQQLADRVAPYLLRRTKEECLDLPEKINVDIRIELPEWQRKLYRAVQHDLIHEVEGMTADQFRRFAPTALTRVLRLSQVASNPALVFPAERRTPVKFEELDKLVDEIVVGSGKKLIIWSYWVPTIEALGRRYSGIGARTLYGATPLGERQEIAASFQAEANPRLLIANPAAAGVGLTLTAATYAIYETVSWRYDLYAQSQDRNHRIGQNLPVTYIRLIADDTIETAIIEALVRKTALARRIVGDDAGSVLVNTLSPESFIHLVRTGALPGPKAS